MSAINMLLKEPVIPFSRKKGEKDIRKVKLEHTVTVNMIANGIAMPYREKRSATLPIAEDGDVEVMIKLGLTFIEASQLDALSLTPGMYYTEFRKCLDGIVLNTYDSLLATVVIRDENNFLFLLGELIGSFTETTAFADQKRYMDTFRKPYKMTVKELGN